MQSTQKTYSSFDDLIVAAAGATIFATLGVSAHNGILDDLNDRVRSLLLGVSPGSVRVARKVTLLSETAVHPLLGYLLSRAASRIVGRHTRVPLHASVIEFVVNKGTRLFVHQHRPPGSKPRIGLDRLGYPSGHTLAATAIAFATALELAEGRSTSDRTWLFGAAAAYAATIGWTRLVLDEHWVDQVIGAWAGGIALAILVHRAERARRSRAPRRMDRETKLRSPVSRGL
jgi:membrane-associated phospholipid phosphatase